MSDKVIHVADELARLNTQYGCTFTREKLQDGRVFLTLQRDKESIIGVGADNAEALQDVSEKAHRLWGAR